MGSKSIYPVAICLVHLHQRKWINVCSNGKRTALRMIRFSTSWPLENRYLDNDMVDRLSCSHVIKIDVPPSIISLSCTWTQSQAHRCRRRGNIFTDHLVWPSIVYTAIFICDTYSSITKLVECVRQCIYHLNCVRNAFSVCCLELREMHDFVDPIWFVVSFV